MVKEDDGLDRGITPMTLVLIKFTLIMVPVVMVIAGITKGDWKEAFLLGLRPVAVGLTPEMLPLLVSANLARGAIKLSKHKVIVKQLNSIQTFGAMDVLCTDKTGTLTEDRVVLVQYIDPSGKNNSNVLKYAYLNSLFQTGLKKPARPGDYRESRRRSRSKSSPSAISSWRRYHSISCAAGCPLFSAGMT